MSTQQNLQRPMRPRRKRKVDPELSVELPPAPPLFGLEPEKPTAPPTHYLWILRRHLWKMVAFVLGCMLITFIVSARIKPIYESTATIDVDLGAPQTVVGQNSNAPTLQDPEVYLTTQIRLIQSDAVLRPVAEQFHMIGASRDGKSPSTASTQSLAAAPVSMSGVKITRPVNTYLLLVSYRSIDPQLAADVANAIATSYLAQSYSQRVRSSTNLSQFMGGQLDELKAKMERSSLALAQYEKEMNVINPEEKTNILSSRLLQLNSDYTNAQADRVSKEAAWNSMKSGSIEAAEVSAEGQPLQKLEDNLNDAKRRVAAVEATYGPRHPEYHKAASELAEVQKQFDATRSSITQRIDIAYKQSLDREQMLQKAVVETKAEWDAINGRSFQYQQLKQEADADKALYNELITKINEAGINASFKNNNIRIADLARPTRIPVYPNTQRYVAEALLFSMLLAIGTVLLLDLLDTTLRSPEEATRILGTEVIGTLPMDSVAAQRIKPPAGEKGDQGSILEVSNGIPGADEKKGSFGSTFGFDEAIRTIRNTILLSDFDHRITSLMITSATPSEGKTTVAVQLAIANAARGKRTLLVDADLRRPSVHPRFGLQPRVGLSSVLNGEVSWQDAVIQIDSIPLLTLLPSGPGSHRAADLIGHQLSELLDQFEQEFDLVILDSPPCLAFAECLQMATAADGVLLITKAGETRRAAVIRVLTTLKRVHANIVGLILNQMKKDTSSDGYGYYNYRYGNEYYKPRQEEKTTIA
jgi:succinoglycan biosynthesis transport protein ExoP